MRANRIVSSLLLIICGLLSIATATAEGGATSATSDQVTLSIKFQPIQSIVVTPGQKEVDIIYTSEEDYSHGVSVTKKDHLTVFSTGGFVVSVASDEYFMKQGSSGAAFILAKDVVVEAATGSNTTIGTFTDASLSTGGKTLITADKGGSALKYDITYNNTAGADNEYINHYYHGDEQSVYSATVTYTIATN